MDEQDWQAADPGAQTGAPTHLADDGRDVPDAPTHVPDAPTHVPDAPTHVPDDLADVDDPQVVAALAALADLSDLELPEHVAVLESVHAALQARLTDAEA